MSLAKDKLVTKHHPIVSHSEVENLICRKAGMDLAIGPKGKTKKGNEKGSSIPTTDAMNEKAIARRITEAIQHGLEIIFGDGDGIPRGDEIVIEGDGARRTVHCWPRRPIEMQGTCQVRL